MGDVAGRGVAPDDGAGAGQRVVIAPYRRPPQHRCSAVTAPRGPYDRRQRADPPRSATGPAATAARSPTAAVSLAAPISDLSATRPNNEKRAAAQPSQHRGGRTTAVRDWARSNGYEVSDRGRIPTAAQEAFDAAH